MKQLSYIIIVLLIGSMGLFAQDKFDAAEEELEALADSIDQDSADVELPAEREYKSTRIESEDQEEDEDEWEDWDEWRTKSEKSRVSRKKRGYFRGGAGGWDFYLMDLNVDEINTKLTEIGITEFDPQISLNGGGGWGFIGHGIRIGGLGAHGQVKSSGGSQLTNGTRINKEVTFSINFAGFMIEKVYHPFNKTELYWGTTIGGGNARLQFEQWSAAADWNGIWDGYNNAVINDSSSVRYTDYQNELSSGYFTLLPTIGFRYNIFRWAAIGANVGYLYMKQNQDGWRLEGKAVSGAPSIDFSNIIYRLNFYFGG